MQLRQNVDYGYLQGTFPIKTKRFENLGALSLSPQPATAQRVSAGLFWYAADASSLVDDVYRNGPNDRRSWAVAWLTAPREGTEIATASGRRNLACRLYKPKSIFHTNPFSRPQTQQTPTRDTASASLERTGRPFRGGPDWTIIVRTRHSLMQLLHFSFAELNGKTIFAET